MKGLRARLAGMWQDPKKRLVVVAIFAAIVALAVNARRKVAAARAGAPMDGSQAAADPRSSALSMEGGAFWPDMSYGGGGGGSIGPGSLGGGPDWAVQDVIDWQIELADKLDSVLANQAGAGTPAIDVPATPTATAPTNSPPKPSGTGMNVAKPGTVVDGKPIKGWAANPYKPGSYAPLVARPGGGTAIHPSWQPGGTYGPAKPAAPAPKPAAPAPTPARPAAPSGGIGTVRPGTPAPKPLPKPAPKPLYPNAKTFTDARGVVRPVRR